MRCSGCNPLPADSTGLTTNKNTCDFELRITCGISTRNINTLISNQRVRTCSSVIRVKHPGLIVLQGTCCILYGGLQQSISVLNIILKSNGTGSSRDCRILEPALRSPGSIIFPVVSGSARTNQLRIVRNNDIIPVIGTDGGINPIAELRRISKSSDCSSCGLTQCICIDPLECRRSQRCIKLKLSCTFRKFGGSNIGEGIPGAGRKAERIRS